MTLHLTHRGQQGSPVVFLHGLFGQGRNWNTIAKALATDHRVTLLDLPHHGRSPWSDRFDFSEIARAVADAVAAPGTGTGAGTGAGTREPEEPVVLVGHSLGGKVAMLVALLYPERVARLCVADIAPVAYDSLRESLGYARVMRALDLSSIGSRAEADAALAPDVPNTTVRSFLLQNLRHGQDGWRWQVNLEVIDRDQEVVAGWPADLVADQPPYEGPTLWLTGERSDYVTAEHEPVMDRLFPHNRRVTIKNAGHWLHSEQPEVFTEVLRRFLAQGG